MERCDGFGTGYLCLSRAFSGQGNVWDYFADDTCSGIVPTNIAEGSGRSDKDFAHFLSIALGSLHELNTQIVLYERIGYIDNEQSKHLQQKADALQMMISGFKKRLDESNKI